MPSTIYNTGYLWRTSALSLALAIRGFAEVAPAHVNAVQFASYPEHTLVYLVSDREVQYQTGRLVNPDRLYLDIRNTTIGPELKNRIKVTDRFITSIRVAQSGANVTRVVFDLNPDVAEKVTALKNPPGLLVNLERKTSNESIAKIVRKSR